MAVYCTPPTPDPALAPLTSAMRGGRQQVPDLAKASEILCLPSPTRLLHPRMGFVTGVQRETDSSSRLGSGGGATAPLAGTAAAGYQARSWLLETATPRSAGTTPSLPAAELLPSPVHPGKSSPLQPSSCWECAGARPQIPEFHAPRVGCSEAVHLVCGARGSHAEQRKARQGRPLDSALHSQ